MEDVSWDVKKAPIFFFSPITNSLISSLNGRLHPPSSAVEHLLILISCSVASLNKSVYISNLSANRVFASFFPRVTNREEIIENLKGVVSCILISRHTRRCGRGGLDLLASCRFLGVGVEEKKRKESLWVLIKINLALVFLLFLANHLSPFFTVLVYHHKHWWCAKKSSRIWSSQRRPRLSSP